MSRLLGMRATAGIAGCMLLAGAKRWAPLSNKGIVQKGDQKKWCVPTFGYFVFCLEDSEYYLRDAVELLDCRT